MDKWFNVNEDAQIWSGHADSAHKQGWLRAPAAIRAIDMYQGSYQFEEVLVDESKGGADARDPTTTDYPQYWIRIEDVSLEPYGEPTPDNGDTPPPPPETREVSDAELGAALRIVADVFKA